MRDVSGEYLDAVAGLIAQFKEGQRHEISAASELVVRSIAAGGRAWAAESDHVVAREATFRAGGFVAVERLPFEWGGTPVPEGSWEAAGTFPRSSDVALLASSSGADANSVELLVRCQQRGVKTIAFVVQEFASDPRITAEHPSGRKLGDLADVVLDLGGAYGDAHVDIEGLAERVAPTSGVLGAAACWAIFAGAAARLVAEGKPPLIYSSVSLPGGPAAFEAMRRAYTETGMGVRR